jgi:hypothetical protein
MNIFALKNWVVARKKALWILPISVLVVLCLYVFPTRVDYPEEATLGSLGAMVVLVQIATSSFESNTHF